MELLFVVRIPLRNNYLWYEYLCGIIICSTNPYAEIIIICGTNPSAELLFVVRIPLWNYYLRYKSLCEIIICGTRPSAELLFSVRILVENYCIICGTNPSAELLFMVWILCGIIITVQIPLRNYYLRYESLSGTMICRVNLAELRFAE